MQRRRCRDRSIPEVKDALVLEFVLSTDPLLPVNRGFLIFRMPPCKAEAEMVRPPFGGGHGHGVELSVLQDEHL